MSDTRVIGPSTASQLSFDIIYIIACLTYPSPKIKTLEYAFDRNKDDFIHLTHVCRSWRNALLSYPNFWTNIEVPLRNKWFLEEVLFRSADQPLEVLICLGDRMEFLKRHMEIVFPHFHRIQILAVLKTYMSTTDVEDVFHLLDHQPVSALKVFTFDTAHHWYYWGTTPPNFLAKSPNFEELRISSSIISHPMPIFNTIKRLHLQSVQWKASVNQLFDMMGAMPRLESLTLSHLKGLSLTFDMNDMNIRSIQFPNLKTLVLDLKPVILMVVLRYTTMPYGIGWSINIREALLLTPIVDIRPLLSFVSKTRNGTCVTLTMDSDMFLQIDFAQHPSHHRNASLTVVLSYDTEWLLHQLHSLLTSLDLSKVHFCDIIFPSSKSRTPPWLHRYQILFSSLLILFNNLEKLVIACEYTESLWHFVSHLLPGQGFTTLPCPLLDDLKVGLVTTKDQTLAEVLAHRKNAGSVLRNLCVEFNYYDESFREEKKPVFEELVDNVELAALSLEIKDGTCSGKTVTLEDGRIEGYYLSMKFSKRISYTPRYPDIRRRVI